MRKGHIAIFVYFNKRRSSNSINKTALIRYKIIFITKGIDAFAKIIFANDSLILFEKILICEFLAQKVYQYQHLSFYIHQKLD